MQFHTNRDLIAVRIASFIRMHEIGLGNVLKHAPPRWRRSQSVAEVRAVAQERDPPEQAVRIVAESYAHVAHRPPLYQTHPRRGTPF